MMEVGEEIIVQEDIAYGIWVQFREEKSSHEEAETYISAGKDKMPVCVMVSHQESRCDN